MCSNISEAISNLVNAGSPKKESIQIGGLTGSSRAAFIASAFQTAGRPLIVVSESNDRAEALKKDISFFLHSLDEKSSLYLLPDWELLPYEPISPHKEISGQRVEVLESLLYEDQPYILIVTVESLLQKVVPGNVLAEQVVRISTGDEISIEKFRDIAVSTGYEFCDLVEKQGEVSVRGYILDIFPSNSEFPYRIELFGDEVESIREFNPASQRSVHIVDSFVLVPSTELVITENNLKTCLTNLEKLKAQGAHFSSDEIDAFIATVKEGVTEPGIERYAPYFYENMETVFDYVTGDSLLILDESVSVYRKEDSFRNLIEQEYESSFLRGEFFPQPGLFYEMGKGLTESIKEKGGILLDDVVLDSGPHVYSARTKRPQQYKGDITRFLKDHQSTKKRGFKTVVSFRAKGQGERIFEVLTESGLEPALFPYNEEKRTPLKEQPSDLLIVQGDLSGGTVLRDEKLIFVTEEELYGVSRKLKKRKKRTSESFSSGLKDLKPGEYLVHVDYGVGLFTGTREISHGGFTEEFLTIEYADDNRLLIPMDSLNAVQRYSGAADGRVTLNRLGGTAWQKTKKRVKKALLKMADELLKIGATRALVEGHSFSPDGHFHKEFADSFEYEETEDQAKAIEEISLDMEKSRPMDRLVCGDVGYGKTEVAMRAVFKAVMDKKQVAVLVPTTLLAQQHLETFTARFHAFPVHINMLSRFRTPPEQKKIVKEIENGRLDIIIGTHRILQKDIRFKDLGLVIVDEEQRFGVAHKEKLKKIKEKTDVLTLTATPIPRTLHFSMSGVRDLTVIDTPPQNRLSIKTFIKRFDAETIRQAITRELDRNGQVFFLDNRVETIDKTAAYLKDIVPEIEVGVAHGQMHKHELEKVMLRFLDRKVNVLVCTTIIESGLDIPSANTIIINRADKFGLAQLYQLRGRVGRDRHQAFAYLLVPPENILSTVAMKRLLAIEELSELGAGFQLSARDLEIRGAGNLLGSEQSGQIASIGFDFYCRLMEDTIRELKGEPPVDDFDPSINLSVKGFIPKEYVSDLNQRIDLYKRVEELETEEDLTRFKEELQDRYGEHPEPVEKLLAQRHMKSLCQKLKVEKIERKGEWLKATFLDDTPVTLEIILSLIKEKKGKIRPDGESSIRFICTENSWRGKYEVVVSNFSKIIRKITE
ncbi:MAG: transcription-repair coupling factor [Nitrospinota bacterium]